MTARPHTQGHTPQQSMQRDAAPDISAASLSFCPVPHRLFTHCGAVADAACSDGRCSVLHPAPRHEARGRGGHRPTPPGTKKARIWRNAPPWILAKHYIKNNFPRCPTALPSYYREIAPLGQASAHVPHSVHSSGLIEYFSPSEIAPTGHSSIHVPHATQSSPITYAIIFKFYMFIEYLFLLCLQR